jgi:hypothetical protein
MYSSVSPVVRPHVLTTRLPPSVALAPSARKYTMRALA